MKTKNTYIILSAVIILVGFVISIKIIRTNYKMVRGEYYIEAKGKTQQFINSYIN